MLKKLIKILCVVLLLIVGTVVGGFFALKAFLSPEKIHTLAQQYARENWNRQISFQQLSVNWIGLTLKDFALSEENSFEQGTFIKAKEVVAKVDVKALFKKRVQINTLFLNGVEVTLVQQKDGRFNFSSFVKEDTATASADMSATSQHTSQQPLVLKADRLSASDCRFIYRNDISGAQTSLDHLNFAVTQFDLAHPFDLLLNFTTHLTQENQPSIDLPIRLEGTLFLANTEWKKAYLQARSLQASYKTVQLNLQGKAENFTAPVVDVTGNLSGVNNKVLAELLPQLPSFDLPVLALKVQAKTNLTDSRAEFSKIELQTQNNSLSATGNTSWGENFSYALAGSIQTDLSQLVQMTGGSSFHPAGNVNGSFKTLAQGNRNHLSGTFTLKDVSMLYTPFTFEQVSGTVTLADSGAVSAALTGQINQGNFVGNLLYKSANELTDILLKLDIDKFTLATWPSSSQKEASQTATTTSTENRLNLQADVTVGELIVPHFRSGGLALNAQLTDLSDAMTRANGTLSFTLQPGAITDLDVFVKENKLVKILFLPLSIVRKVSQTLRLNLFPSEKERGEIAFTQGTGRYTFDNGVMNVDETVFKSSVADLHGAGTINFPADKLDMKVTATLFSQEAPMVIKITGTPQNPKGKLDVMGTVNSVLGGLLNGKSETTVAEEVTQDTRDAVDTARTDVEETAEVSAEDVRDALKDTAHALKGLFKKKSDQ